MPNPPTWTLPADLDAAVRTTVRDWTEQGKVARLWARDATLWTGTDEASWLGWLGIVDEQLARVDDLRRVAQNARQAGFAHVLLLGMGGSSLCPEVLRMTFGALPGWPALSVLDSTDPAQVRAAEARVDLGRTLCVVSSKSGTTLEPNIFKEYFFERVRDTVGPAKSGDRFIAITDPGSKLEDVARTDRFRHVFHGVPSIGGRYSALSDFGMAPAALMGLDVERLLREAQAMVRACAVRGPAEENPGAVLGAILGVLASHGRDKVTLVAAPGIHDLGAWLEQLLAESTGKAGKGLIPVDREPLGPPELYGRDRLFVYLRLRSAPDVAQDRAVASLQAAAHPVVRIEVPEPYQIAAEFFRWEFATAVAGAILGINPFDQPDVEASKVATRRLTDEFEKTGRLPAEMPILEADGVRLFADPRNAAELAAAERTLPGLLHAHLGRVRPGDYVALLAYVEMAPAHEEVLQGFRTRLRTGTGSPPASVSGHGSSIRPARRTKAARTPGCSSRSRATMPLI
ncbi:MAG TPA: transaldolase, partial [Methylomirabilota bacterium]|nr:transaldolase [Methylomirabilota bacterium]